MSEFTDGLVDRMIARASLVVCDEENKCYEFKCSPWEDREGYWVSFDRCDTPEELLRWINHLSEKNWFTMDVCRCFIHHACGRHGMELHPLKVG